MLNLELPKEILERIEDSARQYGKQTPTHKRYAAELYARIGDVRRLRNVEISIGDWSPLPKECHKNVTLVSVHDDRFTPVRGWLYFDFGGLLEYVLFLAHSVVRLPSGELWDITPAKSLLDYPFLAATESEVEYAALVESGVIQLWHRKESTPTNR